MTTISSPKLQPVLQPPSHSWGPTAMWNPQQVAKHKMDVKVRPLLLQENKIEQNKNQYLGSDY